MRLRFTRRAAQHLDRVLDHIASQSPQGAASVARRVSEVALLLSEHPSIGRRTARARVRRIALVPHPRVIHYRARGDEVEILGVRHAKRRPPP